MSVRILKALLCVVTLTGSIFAASKTAPCPSPRTHMYMEKGSYSPQPGSVFELTDFDADMVARGKTAPLCFTRVTEIKTGTVFVSSDSLTHMFSRKIGQSGHSKVSDVKVETHEDGTAKLSGKMKDHGGVSFSIDGPVSTDGRNLILQGKKIDAAKLPVKWLLGLMGKNLGSMMGSESVSGVLAKGNTLIFQPSQISHVEGHISKMQVTNKGLVLTFGEVQQNKIARNPRSSPEKRP